MGVTKLNDYTVVCFPRLLLSGGQYTLSNDQYAAYSQKEILRNTTFMKTANRLLVTTDDSFMLMSKLMHSTCASIKEFV